MISVMPIHGTRIYSDEAIGEAACIDGARLRRYSPMSFRNWSMSCMVK